MAKTYHVKAIWDAEAGVYYSRTDIPGLNIEAATLPEFIAIAEDLAPQMLEANVTGKGAGETVKWKVSAELDFAAA